MPSGVATRYGGAMDDESVTRFKQEMQALEEAGGVGARLRRDAIYGFAGFVAVALWLFAAAALAGLFPREAGGAIGLAGTLVMCSLNLLLAILLWRWRSKDWLLTLYSVTLAGMSCLMLAGYLLGRLG